MTDWISITLQVLATVTTFGGSWLNGNKSPWGPAILAVSAGLFTALNIYYGLWLVVPCCVVGGIIHVRNYRKWAKET